MVTIFITVVGIIACFLLGAGNIAAAARELYEKKWGEFGCSCMLAICSIMAIALILQMRFGV